MVKEKGEDTSFREFNERYIKTNESRNHGYK